MNKKHQRIGLLASPAVAAVLLGSCIAPGYLADARYPSSGGGHGVYTTLPANFSGNTYHHDGRYYSGGRYQTGKYSHDGQSYASRYYHNGNYIYGGRYQRHGESRNRSGNYAGDYHPDRSGRYPLRTNHR